MYGSIAAASLECRQATVKGQKRSRAPNLRSNSRACMSPRLRQKQGCWVAAWGGQRAPLLMPRRWMGGARAQKATKGDMAAASSRNAARQPRGPATNPPNMYPCQTTCGSVTLAAMHLLNLLLLLVLVVHDVPARPGKVHLQTSCRYRLPKKYPLLDSPESK